MPERKYVLTKVASGDYLLPSNDATRLWRIVRYPDNGREVWAAWRWRERVRPEAPVPDRDDWSAWEEMESLLPTRQAAIDAALRITEEPR